MEIFCTTKFARYLNDKTYREKKLAESARPFLRVINKLRACETLEIFIHLENVYKRRCHLLKGNLKGIFSCDLEHPFRLLFKPDPPAELKGHEMDISSVRSIRIVDVKINTHE